MKKRICYLAGLLMFGILTGCSLEQSVQKNYESIKKDEIHEEKTSDESENKVNSDSVDEAIEDNREDRKTIISEEVNFLNYAYCFWYEDGAGERDSYLHYPESLWIEKYGEDYSQVVSFYEDDEMSEELFAFILYLGEYVGEKPADYPIQQKDETQLDFHNRKKEYLEKKAFEVAEQLDLQIVQNYPYPLDVFRYCGPYAVYSVETKNYQLAEGEGVCTVVGTIKEIVELCEDGLPIQGWYCRFVSAVRPDIVELMNGDNIEYADDVWGYYPSEIDEDLDVSRQVTLVVDVSK